MSLLVGLLRSQQSGARSDSAQRTSNVLKATTTYTAFNDAGGDDVALTVDAAVGDRLLVGISAQWNNEAVTARVDAATIVAGTPVTWLSTRTGTHDYGVVAWSGQPSVYAGIGSPRSYVVQSADIENGQVTLQFYIRCDTAAAKILLGTAENPIECWTVNLGNG